MIDLVNRGLVTLNDQESDAASGHRRESTIVVTGVARGGTSMLAQVLGQLGLFLGDTCDRVVVEDTEILGALQTSDMGSLEGIIADRNQRFAKWGFKVPNLHNFLPATDARRFRNPRYIVVFRDPLAVARRMELSEHYDAAGAIREAGAEVMKLTSYVCALAAPALLISYEKALQNAEYVIEAMSAFCGLTPSDEQKAAALATIAPNGLDYILTTHLACRGTIDNISGNILRGWCRYHDTTDVVEIEVFADEEIIGVFPSGDYREDLLDAAIGLGYHAFNVDLTAFNIHSSTVISVRPAGHTLALANSFLSVEELRKREGQIRAMKIKIIMMLKDEDDLALPWIKYHGSLVGYDNLIILDNGSTSDRTLSALKWGAEAGATVSYQYATQSDFVSRGRTYVEMIQQMDAEDPADFYLPLDCDEFLSVERDGRIDCSRRALEEELSSYIKCQNPLMIHAGLDNHPHKAGFFRWSPRQRKTFFAEGACEFLDLGFRVGRSHLGLDPIRTRLVYIHYHFKPYDLLIAHSKMKLEPFTTDFSHENMRKYVDEKKDGWHCAAHILESREGYASGFNDPAFIEFPEIQDKFESLGERLPFS